ncbi:MAG: histidine kinase [Chloroflexota bacterium]
MAGFFADNIVVVYFFYGLAFFCMGLAILLESARIRSSEISLSTALLPLAAFGIIHGLQEWFEMFELMAATGAANIPNWLLRPEVRIAHLVVSFLMLIAFGIMLFYANRRHDGREGLYAVLGAAAFLMIWLMSVSSTLAVYQPGYADMLDAADVLSRYILGIPGALIAAWAIWLEQRNFQEHGVPGFGRALLGAAIAIFVYGVIGQVFTRPSFLFPASVINSRTFLDWFGFPVQVLRAAMGVLMAYFIIRALNVFEVESQERLDEARRQRRLAQDEALRTQQDARRRTEQLNRELQTAVKDLTLLFSLSSQLAGTLDRSELMEESVPLLVSAFPQVNAGMLMVRRDQGSELDIVSIIECDDPTVQTDERREDGERLGRQVAQTGLPAWLVDREIVPLEIATSVEDVLSPRFLSEPTGGHTMAMPLFAQGQVIGSLVLCSLRESQPFTPHDVSLARTIADQLSIAIDNATLYAQVSQHDQLRGEFLHRVVSAQEAERKRIARELHDGTGQTLTALGLGLAAAADRMEHDPELARKHLMEMRQLNDNALKELHEVLSDLRPSVLDNLGLVPALRGQVQGFEARTGIHVQMQVEGKIQRLMPDVETTVFRIAQEALTNVTRHAAADSVAICLKFAPDEVKIQVTDDGRGFDPLATLANGNPDALPAWGLMGIEERAGLVGGTSKIISQPGQGTTVEVVVPNPYREAIHE